MFLIIFIRRRLRGKSLYRSGAFKKKIKPKNREIKVKTIFQDCFRFTNIPEFYVFFSTIFVLTMIVIPNPHPDD